MKNGYRDIFRGRTIALYHTTIFGWLWWEHRGWGILGMAFGASVAFWAILAVYNVSTHHKRAKLTWQVMQRIFRAGRLVASGAVDQPLPEPQTGLEEFCFRCAAEGEAVRAIYKVHTGVKGGVIPVCLKHAREQAIQNGKDARTETTNVQPAAA